MAENLKTTEQCCFNVPPSIIKWGHHVLSVEVSEDNEDASVVAQEEYVE